MVTWKQRLQGATLYALKFIKTIKSKENKTMETVYYKSYKELVSEYFGIDYKVGENAPKLSKQLSKKGIEYTQEELQAFSELLLAVFSDCKELVYTFKLSDVLPSYRDAEDWAFDGSCNEPGGAGELTSIALQTSDLARYCYIFNENNSPLFDDSSCCEDCGDYFYNEDLEDGSDGCLYCSDCIHDHLEDEEEIA